MIASSEQTDPQGVGADRLPLSLKPLLPTEMRTSAPLSAS